MPSAAQAPRIGPGRPRLAVLTQPGSERRANTPAGQGGRPPAMNIVVCVKQVPDTWAERTLRTDDSRLDRASVDGVINELDEYAIEEGLRLAEAHGGEVTILSMGPEQGQRVDQEGTVHGGRQGGAPGGRRAGGVRRARHLAGHGHRAPADRVRPGDPGLGVDRRPDGRAPRDAGRAPWRPPAHPGQQGGDRRERDHHPPAGRLRLRQGGGRPARRGQRGREDQRAAVPVVQGDHGGQEEAGGGAERRRRRDRPGPGGPGRRGDRGGQLRASGRPARQARSSRTRATAASRRPSSSPRRSSSDRKAAKSHV